MLLRAQALTARHSYNATNLGNIVANRRNSHEQPEGYDVILIDFVEIRIRCAAC